MSPNQLQAARVLLGLSQGQVARSAGLSVPTVKRAEGQGKIRASANAIAAIRLALEAAGVIFVEPNGEGAGVRLRKP